MPTPRALLTTALLLLPFVAALVIAQLAPPPNVAQMAQPVDVPQTTASAVSMASASAPMVTALR